jgi:hypothetical protein
VYATGENFSSRLTFKEPHYADHFRIDAFRSEAAGHNWGPSPWFLPELQSVKSDDVKVWSDEWAEYVNDSAEYLLGLILIHDSTLWPAWIPPSTVKRWRHALREADFSDQYTFIPYWEQDVVDLRREQTYVSFYVDRERGRLLVVYLNHTDGSEPVRLDLDWEKLGLDPAGATAKSLAHGYLGERNRAGLDGGTLEFFCTPQDYRLIYVQE